MLNGLGLDSGPGGLHCEGFLEAMSLDIERGCRRMSKGLRESIDFGSGDGRKSSHRLNQLTSGFSFSFDT